MASLITRIAPVREDWQHLCITDRAVRCPLTVLHPPSLTISGLAALWGRASWILVPARPKRYCEIKLPPNAQKSDIWRFCISLLVVWTVSLPPIAWVANNKVDGVPPDLAMHLLALHWNRQHFGFMTTYRPRECSLSIKSGMSR